MPNRPPIHRPAGQQQAKQQARKQYDKEQAAARGEDMDHAGNDIAYGFSHSILFASCAEMKAGSSLLRTWITSRQSMGRAIHCSGRWAIIADCATRTTAARLRARMADSAEIRSERHATRMSLYQNDTLSANVRPGAYDISVVFRL
jgi:hypothetical protein